MTPKKQTRAGAWAAVLEQPRVREALRQRQALDAARRAHAAPVTSAEPAIAEPTGPAMNQTERRYEQRLIAEGHAPRFTALTICVTSQLRRRRRYTPDFLVPTEAGVELHEVKGAHVREDASLKFEFAVEQWGHVFTFVWAQWARGEWTIRRYPRRNSDG